MSDIDIVFEEIEKAIDQQTLNMQRTHGKVKKWLPVMGARECLLHLKHDIVMALEKAKVRNV